MQLLKLKQNPVSSSHRDMEQLFLDIYIYPETRAQW